MMKSDEYWQQRMETLNEAELKKGEDYIRQQQREYEKSLARIKKETESWYVRLAKNNEVSMAEARKLLTANELQEFHWDVEEYIKRGRENAVDQRWVKQLENASAKVHISRLEEIELRTRQELEMLTARRLKGTTDVLGDIYKDGYYKGIYEVQRGIGQGLPFAKLDVRQIDKVLAKPWAPDGRNFSARIWADRDKLVAELQTVLTQDLIRGGNIEDVIAQFTKKMNVSRHAAERLIRTEAAFFSGQSRLDSYKETGVKHYKYVATMDARTSDICRDMEGKVMPISEAKAGVNYPPLHAYCRSTTIPHYEDDVEIDDNEAYKVKEDETYKEWAKEHAPEDATEPVEVDEPKPTIPPTVRTTSGEPLEFKSSKEAIEWIDEVSPDWLRELTPSEKTSIRVYTGNDYREINEALRTGEYLDEWEDTINAISNGLRKFNLTNEVTVYRGSENYLKGIAPKDLIGAKITEAAFLSTALLKEKAHTGDLRLTIKAPPGSIGAPVMLISSHPEEIEFLFDKGTRYVILEANEKDGILYLLVEVIPDAD